MNVDRQIIDGVTGAWVKLSHEEASKQPTGILRVKDSRDDGWLILKSPSTLLYWRYIQRFTPLHFSLTKAVAHVRIIKKKYLWDWEIDNLPEASVQAKNYFDTSEEAIASAHKFCCAIEAKCEIVKQVSPPSKPETKEQRLLRLILADLRFVSGECYTVSHTDRLHLKPEDVRELKRMQNKGKGKK